MKRNMPWPIKYWPPFIQDVTAKEFYNLSSGIDTLELKDNSNYAAKIETTLSQPLANKNLYYAEIDDQYSFDTTSYWAGFWTQQYPSAVLFKLPLSKDQFEIWMAYRLANTILFSPAVELVRGLHRHPACTLPADKDAG